MSARLGQGLAAASTALVFLLAACGGADTGAAGEEGALETVRLGAIATGSAPEEKERYEKIAADLEEDLSAEVELVTSTDYYAIAEALRGGRLDMAFLNSLGFVLTEQKVDIEPLAVGVDESGEPGYYSYLITNKPDEIAGPEDVKGRTLAMSSSLSTSGFLFPTAALQEVGLDAEADTTLSQGGNHAANILAVASGQVDAAFVDSVEYESAVEDGDIDPDEVVKVWQSDRITGSPVVVRSDLSQEQKDALQEALLALEGTDEVPLGVEKSMKMAKAESAEYAPIRELAREAGLSVKDMQG